MPDNQELLNSELCDCTSVKDLIEQSMRIAMGFHEEGDCKASQMARVLLITAYYIKIFYMMERRIGGKEGEKQAKEMAAEISAFCGKVDNECNEFQMALFKRLCAESNEKHLGIPVGTTIQ